MEVFGRSAGKFRGRAAKIPPVPGLIQAENLAWEMQGNFARAKSVSYGPYEGHRSVLPQPDAAAALTREVSAPGLMRRAARVSQDGWRLIGAKFAQ